jgi:hypothetical protein
MGYTESVKRSKKGKYGFPLKKAERDLGHFVA